MRGSKSKTLPMYNKSKKAKSSAPTANSDGMLGLPMSRSFPLGPWTMLGSCAFWIGVTYIAYKSFLYFGTYRSIDMSDLSTPCSVHVKGTVPENLQIVENYTSGDSGPYLKRIGSEMYTDSFVGTESPKEMKSPPPVVTAVSSADFFMVQRLIRDIEEVNNLGKVTVKLIIYDIGLYSKEKKLIKDYCNCDVRTFDSSHYPDHVGQMENTAYQPIIMQVVLEEFGSVIWIDPSAKLKNAKDLGMLRLRGSHDFFLWEEDIYNSVVSYTHPKMFEFFGEKRCTFSDFGMMDTRTIVLYRTNLTWLAIMKPWLKCALNKDCIAPKGAKNSECFHWERPKMTGCHWFSQSAFSIIVNRVFQFSLHIDKYSIPRLTVYDDPEVVYHFPVQPWTFTELLLAFTLPLMVLSVLIYLYLRRARSLKAQYMRR